MTIETKFNLGDVVWFKVCGEIVHCARASIRVEVEDDLVQVWYFFGDYFGQPEELLFTSEEELLKNE